ncbi:MAG: pyridoxine 5'-phosphate synthase, partial [Elusimicrobiota bacterium]
QEMLSIAKEIEPHMVTFVPEKREELTTEGVLNVVEKIREISAVASALMDHNILVSLFINPELNQLKAAAKCHVNYVELHTGFFANAIGSVKGEELKRLEDMAMAANKLGLGINAGHGLDYFNVRYVAAIPYIEELSIGHAIIARAVLVGIDRAVRDMVVLISHPKYSER